MYVVSMGSLFSILLEKKVLFLAFLNVSGASTVPQVLF